MSGHAGMLEPEPAGLLRRNVSTAGYLLSGATAFFFISFLFAYVYLRSLNSGGLWHPKGVDPPVGLGTAWAVLIVLCAVAIRLALADERAGRGAAARSAKLGAGLACGLGAVVVQVVEWGTIGFGPTDGAYASVFIGWTCFYLFFTILALYWLETEFATAVRHGGDSSDGTGGLSFFWTFFAGVGIITWIVLFLISP